MAITRKETKQICDAHKRIWEERRAAGWTLRQRAGIDQSVCGCCDKPTTEEPKHCQRCNDPAKTKLAFSGWVGLIICAECEKAVAG